MTAGITPMKRELKELQLLFEISQILDRTLDLREAVGPVIDAMAAHMGTVRGTLALINRQTGEISIDAAHGLSESQKERGRYRVGEGVTGKVIQTGRPMVVPRVSEDPLFLNAKLCTPEGSLFGGSPAIGGGIYYIGFKEDVTDFNVLYLMLQKSLPFGGYVAGGLYHGVNSVLLTSSDGDVNQTGAMFGWASPDVEIGLRGLRKLNVVADVQTGENVLGAWGFGSNVYFADNVSLLVGPVFFFDRNLQPGGSKYMWSAQLDVDIPLGR